MNKILNIKNLANLLFGLLLTCCCANKESPKKGNILVLDDFDKKEVFINDDNIPDVSHGEIVADIIEKGLPEYNVERKSFHIYNIQNKSIKENLFNNLVNNNKKYDAANISIGLSVDFDVLSAITKINVNKDNIAEKTKELKRFFKNNPDITFCNDDFVPIKMGGIADILEVLDSLNAKGTQLYISSPNDGPFRFNILSLADNSICVGSTDGNNIKYYSGNNSLIKRFYNDELIINKTSKGYSIDGGRTTSFTQAQVSQKSNIEYSKKQMGASYATPRVLVMDFCRK